MSWHIHIPVDWCFCVFLSTPPCFRLALTGHMRPQMWIFSVGRSIFRVRRTVPPGWYPQWIRGCPKMGIAPDGSTRSVDGQSCSDDLWLPPISGHQERFLLDVHWGGSSPASKYCRCNKRAAIRRFWSKRERELGVQVDMEDTSYLQIGTHSDIQTIYYIICIYINICTYIYICTYVRINN